MEKPSTGNVWCDGVELIADLRLFVNGWSVNGWKCGWIVAKLLTTCPHQPLRSHIPSIFYRPTLFSLRANMRKEEKR